MRRHSEPSLFDFIIDKIKAAAPELLDGNTADIMDWIDNAFAMYAEDTDIAAKMDEEVKK